MRRIKNLLWSFGVDIKVARRAPAGIVRYLRDRHAFRVASAHEPEALPLGHDFPVFHDYSESAGTARGHYFHMDLWAARRIYTVNPTRHIDIGSRIDGFVAHVLSFREIEVIDVRPLESVVHGLTFVQADATTLSEFPDSSVESISCLHAAEHFGLGRYGDPIDPLAYRKLLNALQRILAPGGRLYFAVPIGVERVEFNAHRVFDPERIIGELSLLELVNFGAVEDDGSLSSDVQPADYRSARMACGLYEFIKRE